ncbi:MAG: xylulokinase [Solirubrobacteraceae bacterium]
MRSGGPPLFMAVDAGTTGARAAAVDLKGRLVREARRPYATDTPRPGWAQQNPDDWRAMALAAIADLVATVGAERIAAIGLTGQCPTVAPVDAAGDPIGPGLMYRDNRATAEAQQMREQVGAAAMHERTGHVAEAFHVGPKILWMRAHRPALFATAHRFVQPRDLVLHALTGEAATDETHANATVFFDLRARSWAEDLLASFSLEPAIFPRVVAPWVTAGELAAPVARLTGASAGCPVVIGAADSQCAAFGSGVNEPGAVSEMAGASSCLNSIVVEPLSDVRVTHYSHVIADRYCTEVGVNTTGAALQWALSALGYPDYASLEAGARRVHDALRRGASEDPLALAPLFLPYLGDGERDDPTLRAGFVGLADRHGRDELAYAVLEGVAFAVAEMIEILIAAGSPCEELRVAGGGGRLSTLSAIKSDVLGIPVVHLLDDTAAVGVALLAARSVGHASESEAALDAVLARASRFEPQASASEQLRHRRAWFRSVRSSAAMRMDAEPANAGGP